MIVTLTDTGGGVGKSILAGRLAATRALAGRKVLLLDADPSGCALRHCGRAGDAGGPHLMARAISAKGLQPELEHLTTCYQDIVIDSEARDSLGSRSALIAAGIAIVALEAGHSDTASRQRLVQRIGHARLFNPGLRVVIVLACEDAQPAPQGRLDLEALLGHIPAAALTGLEQLYTTVFQ